MVVDNPITITVDYIDPSTKKRVPVANYTTGDSPLYFGQVCYNSFYTPPLINPALADRATAAAFVAVYLSCSNPIFSGLEGPFVRDVLDLAKKAQAYNGNLYAHHVFRKFTHPESLVTQAYLDRWSLKIVDGAVIIQ